MLSIVRTQERIKKVESFDFDKNKLEPIELILEQVPLLILIKFHLLTDEFVRKKCKTLQSTTIHANKHSDIVEKFGLIEVHYVDFQIRNTTGNL